MKYSIVLFTLIFTLSTFCFAQNRPNYSGEWILDLGKSKISDGMPNPAITKSIKQTDEEIEILDDAIAAKLLKGASQPTIYNLNWNETSKETENSPNKMFISSKSGFNKGNLFEIFQRRKKEGQVSETTLTEVWELMDEGKVLKIKTIFSNSSNEQTSEVLFTRVNNLQKSKKDSDAIINGKATRLVTPPYPPEAGKVNATGNVGVEILVDEKGNVILAKAFAGHPALLKVSEESARLCKFSQTKIQGVPVKVAGIIIYNFSKP